MLLEAPVHPLERLSASSLSLFASCPEAFRRKYLLNEPEKNFGGRFVGSVNHGVFRTLLLRKKANLMVDEEIARLAYKQVWEETLEADGEPDWRKDDPIEMFRRGTQMISLFQEAVFPSINPVAVEERFQLELPDGLPDLSGYIDCREIDKIREFKTTSAKQTKPKSKWSFQARIYQLAFPIGVDWTILTRQAEPKLYTSAENMRLYLPVRDAEVTMMMVREEANRILDLNDRLGPDRPWPVEGIFSDWLCDYCAAGPEARGDCVAWR